MYIMSSLSSRVILQIANIIACIVTITVNLFASFASLNGRATGAISDLYPALVTPAGYVFSIWSVIYTLLLVFIIYQALPRNRDKDFLGKIGYLFVLSCVANIAWLFLWHYLMPIASVFMMFVLLGSLIAIYLRLEIGCSKAPLREKLAVHLPFSVYLGWITVAPIANVAAALISVGWYGGGLGEVLWTDLVIAIALAITLAVLYTRSDIGYGLVIVWALGGIIVKQAGEQSIVYTAGASAAIIALMLAWTAFKLASGRKKERSAHN